MGSLLELEEIGLGDVLEREKAELQIYSKTLPEKTSRSGAVFQYLRAWGRNGFGCKNKKFSYEQIKF